jgi:hypothetical protein
VVVGVTGIVFDMTRARRVHRELLGESPRPLETDWAMVTFWCPSQSSSRTIPIHTDGRGFQGFWFGQDNTNLAAGSQ